MPLFTIETTYHLPVYRHRTYEAASLQEACAAALADDDWEGQDEDYETAGDSYLTGAWEGDEAYHGNALALPTITFRVDRAVSAPGRVAIFRDGIEICTAPDTQSHRAVLEDVVCGLRSALPANASGASPDYLARFPEGARPYVERAYSDGYEDGSNSAGEVTEVLVAALQDIASKATEKPEPEEYDDTESAYGNGLDVAQWETGQIAQHALWKTGQSDVAPYDLQQAAARQAWLDAGNKIDAEAESDGEWPFYFVDEPSADFGPDPRSVERDGERRVYFEDAASACAEYSIEWDVKRDT